MMIRTLIPHSSDPHFLFRSPSFSTLNQKPIFLFHKKCLTNHQNAILTSSFTTHCTANSAAGYNGWDDLRLWVDSAELSEPNHVKKLLTLLGIHDRKYVFTCILGFVCALAVSRVRVSSIIVFPAAAIVFAIGFSFGFVNGRPTHVKGLGKRSVKVDSLGVFVEKLKTLVEIFDGFDVKLKELEDGVKNVIDCESVGLSDLESYVSSLKCIDGLVLDARNVVDDCIGSVTTFGGELQDVEHNLYQKNSRKKKGNANNGFELFGFMGSLFRGNGVGSKTSRTNVMRRDGVAKDLHSRAQDDMRGSAAGRALDSVASVDSRTPNGVASRDSGRKNILGDRSPDMETILQSDNFDAMEERMDSRTSGDAGDVRFKYQSMRFVDDRRISFNMSTRREFRKWTSDDTMRSYTEFDISKEHEEDQQIFGDSNGAYESSRGMENGGYKDYRASLREERMNVEDELHTRKYQPRPEKNVESFSSSTLSDDLLFNRCITKANDLLKRARKHLKVRNDEVAVEEMLVQSAELLTEAISVKPMSLLAIGQLGNTYLLHGELKLRTSRELRNVLSRSSNLGLEGQSSLLSSVDETLSHKDRIATLLANACEESEGFLVEAGRRYRLALSIDGSDMRALYNWGLALFFRAQLIADIGPEAAPDADKLFLAAIDKFDAMMSKSNAYLPEALFRWAVALQQRSRLRPANNRDKVKLLQQAKRLYEDALDMGSNKLQVREALSSCMSELDFADTQSYFRR